MTADMSCVLPGLTIGLNGVGSECVGGSGVTSAADEMTKSNAGMNRFEEDLTEIDRQASDLDTRIVETREEVKYITSLLMKYEEIRSDLNNKLQGLENQRRNVLMKKNDLLATHDVFGSPMTAHAGISSLFSDHHQHHHSIMNNMVGSGVASQADLSSSNSSSLVSKSILLPKLNGNKDKILLETPSCRNIQDMVSELFSSSEFKSKNAPSSSSLSSPNSTTGGNNSCSLTGFNNSLNLVNLSSHRDSCLTPTNSIDGLKDAFTPLALFDQRSSRISTPIGTIPPLSFSEAVAVSASTAPQHPQQQQQHQQQQQKQNISGGKGMGNTDPQSPTSGSTSPLSNFGMNCKEMEEDLDSFLGVSATPSPVGSNTCIIGPKSGTSITSTITATPATASSSTLSSSSENNGNTSGSSNSNNTSTNNSTSRFIMRQANGTQVAVGQNRAVTYNSVLCLETSSNGYVYKSLADRSVSRSRFGNLKDTRSYQGHGDRVKVLCLDSNLQQLYSGCDDGKVRCFNISTGSLLSEFQCEGAVIGLEKGWDNCLIIATNKGWIYMCKNHFSTIVATHRTFNWICTFKPLLTANDRDLRNKRCLLVLPMKHRPTIIDAIDGKVLKEITACPLIESKPCLQVNGGISIIATVFDKNETPRSEISVFDASQEWGCIQKIKKEGIVAALRIHGTDLYVGLKFPSFGHIECYKWSNKALSLKWIACVAYVSCIAVLPSDVVLNGGPDGTVYNTTPNLKGPFPCSSPKCKCKQPFARRKDLEFHYSKVGTTSTTTTTATPATTTLSNTATAAGS